VKIIKSAVQTLYRIVGSGRGAQAAVDANVLEIVAELLELPDEEVRKWTRYMLEELGNRQATRRAAVGCLVSLLRRVSIECS
jgi:hypothetical protein